MIMKLPSGSIGQPIVPGSDTDWQILGELELPFGVDAGSVINTWLSDVLTSLYLHVDFFNKIWKSAEDAAARSMQAQRVLKDQHIRFLLFIPARRPLNLKTWGFFCIEKAKPAGENKNPCEHSIEFYLYLEG
jgi:hypothetical protein